MKFCGKCGFQNEDAAGFCVKCGNPLAVGNATAQNEKPPVNQVAPPVQNTPYNYPPASAYQQRPMKPVKPKKPKKTDIKMPIIALVLSLAITAGSVCGLIFTRTGGIGSISDLPQAGEKNDVSSEISYDYDNINKKSNIKKIDISTTPDQTVENDMVKIKNVISAAETEVAAEYPEITEETASYYSRAVYDKMYELRNNNEIKGVNSSYYGDSVTIEMNSGNEYVYTPHIKDTLSGTSGADKIDLKISTYLPLASDSSFKNTSNTMVESAKAVDDGLKAYSYDNRNASDDDSFEGEELTFDATFKMGNYNYLIWYGHGSYTYQTGPMLCIPKEKGKYPYNTFSPDEVKCSSDSYLLTAEYFDKIIPDGALENTVVIFGACNSCKDRKLSDIIVEKKGAAAMLGFDGTVYAGYCSNFIKSFSEKLADEKGGSYPTVKEAFEYAQSDVGESDAHGTMAVLVTEDENYSLDWYEDHVTADRSVALVLDHSGSMDGEPMKNTKTAAKKFVRSMVENNTASSVIIYDDRAEKLTDFSANASRLESVIDTIEPDGGTNIDAGLQIAEELLNNSKSKKKIIILMTDGVANSGRTGDSLLAYANKLKESGIDIYTLGFFSNLYSEEKTTSQQLLNNMANPCCYYDIADIDDVQYVFGDIADVLSGQRYMYVRIACPVNVSVEYDGQELSSEGSGKNRTDFGMLYYENADGEEQADPSYDENNQNDENRVKVLRLKSGHEYKVNIDGTGRGKMNYTISFMDKDGNYTDIREFKNITIKRDSEIETTAAEKKVSVMTVDEDGDGKIDYTYTAKVNGKAKKEAYKTNFFVYPIILGCVATLASTVFLIIRVTRRKKKKAMQKNNI